MAKKAETIANYSAFANEEFYGILEVPQTATKEEIAKAFKKASLKHHPDKNKENKEEATKRFLLVKKAQDVLTDEKARAAYDNVIKVKVEREKRKSTLDADRKRKLQDLEEREAKYKKQKSEEEEAKRRLDQEIERLRKEGYRRMLEEQEQKKQKEREEKQKQEPKEHSSTSSTLNIKWDKSKSDYSKERLESIFKLFGAIDMIVVSKSKKKGSAMVVFKTSSSASLALKNSLGEEGNKLKLSLATSAVPEAPAPFTAPPPGLFDDQEHQQDFSIPTKVSVEDHLDFEQQVLQSMMHAAQQQKAST